ncbi:phosphotransferase family protein [Wenjunlia tyrosinilytica]|jgi:aminoglycoside phosphotransferase (APT) family kinase protein|uniref:Acyl-CoA dehydrogenase n=1 Tax=Wenjunlia tyrosinilytica TaxID=1544741 RepID=A0A918DUG0_9ACTN|nr:phosphotransferase family protein [Wenjunlia tyrosinilytica]GGO84432.1 acyl-CoA dehydrogenase [Wenjunlia tyrosinilytica]
MEGTAETALPGLDLAVLRDWLDTRHPGFAQGPLTGELIAGGRSNLTYTVTDGARRWVLRRPPLGHVLATAHDMAREYRVISALAPTPVPVPVTHLLCEDPEVLGAPFYVMQHVEGQVLRGAGQTARLGRERARELSGHLMDVLADLHTVDPAEVGLADFGRPQGYLNRQVVRWGKQLAASRSRDTPELDSLHKRLLDSVPATQRTGIVHGDFRLDNAVVGEDGRIAAVLDWEMATLGDPLADLGLFLVYWDVIRELLPDNPVAQGISDKAGFPPGAELVEQYARRSGLDLEPLAWYVAFGCLKLAVIAEGIHFRYLQGLTVGEGFDQIGTMVAPLASRGLSGLS